MIYMWFTGINYYKLAVEKDRDSIFTNGNHTPESRYKRSVTYISAMRVMDCENDKSCFVVTKGLFPYR